MSDVGHRTPSSHVLFDCLLHRAETEPINVDISNYGDEFCEGFLAGQRNILEEIRAGRLAVPHGEPPGVNPRATKRNPNAEYYGEGENGGF